MFLIVLVVLMLTAFSPDIMLWMNLLMMSICLILWFKYASTYSQRVQAGLYALLFSASAGLAELINYF